MGEASRAEAAGERTIDWQDGAIVIIDQTALPDELRWLTIDDVDMLADAIKRLAVRGAMALGVAGALGVALAAQRAGVGGSRIAVERAARVLEDARPTAVNLAVGIHRVVAASIHGPAAALAEALRVRDEDIAANRAIGIRGAAYLRGGHRILTHCNAGALAGVEWGTALSVIRALHGAGSLSEVFAAETRPLLQGARLTTWELGRLSIPHRLIVDSAAAGLILSGRIDAVVVGADRIAANGDVANKVGTLAHALAAKRAGIPFVVAAPESTIDPHTPDGKSIPIEERSEEEVLTVRGCRIAPVGTRALNPAFDVTPMDLVSAIITEKRTIIIGRDAVIAETLVGTNES